MPKVTVMSLPEESIKLFDIPKTAEKNKSAQIVAWKKIIGALKMFLSDFCTRDVLLVSCLAFLLSRVVIMGEMAPFGLAFFAALAPVLRKKAYLCGVSALLGLISCGQYMACGIYFFAMFAYFRMGEKVTRTHNKLLAVPLLMFFAVAVSGLVIMFAMWEQATLYTAVLTLFNAALTTIGILLFKYSVPLFVSGEKSGEVSSESYICTVLLLAVAVSGLSDIKVFSVSMCNILGSLLIISAAYCGSMGSGSAAGTIIGLTIGMGSGQVFSVALYALSGVIAGCLRSLNKYAAVLGFLLGNIIIVLYFGQTENAMQYITEASVASSIFLLIPKSGLMLWYQRMLDNGDLMGEEKIKGAIQKLESIAGMLKDLGGAGVHFSAEAKSRLREEEIARALSQAGGKLCESCSERSKCWEENFYSTSQAMMDMIELAEKRGLNMNVIPRYFVEHCVKKNELMGTIKLVVEHNQAQSYWQNRMFKERQLVNEQVKATAAIIASLAQEIKKEPSINKPMAIRLKEKAATLDCQLDKVIVKGKNGTTVVEIMKQPCNGRRECVNTILPLAAGLLREKMIINSKCGSNRTKPCKISMHAAKNYSITTGIASAAKHQNDVNGDNCAVVPLKNGKVAIILSDGMGSGEEAAGESSMAIKFLKRMLEAGFAVDIAVQTVNAMLLLKAPDEKFATMDMLILDLYSAEGEFLKIGAAPSFLKRVREVGMIKKNSLPIGILNHIEIDPIKVQLAAGDSIVMVSDGIMDAPKSGIDKDVWLSNFLRCLSDAHPEEIAGKVLSEAQRAAGGKGQDDMTVLCIKITQK